MSIGIRRDDHNWNGLGATAITPTMLYLCSAPCKALRFAPTALVRPQWIDAWLERHAPEVRGGRSGDGAEVVS